MDDRLAQLQQLLDQPPSPTRRPVSEGMENELYRLHPILDHGFVRVIDYMGDDNAIVQAARVSYGKGTKSVTGDRGLIRYLMRHRHTTPFEMCEVKLHIKLPIFVARQWIRHRTANVNEYSARYSILDREFYLPANDMISAQSVSNRQGRGGVVPPEEAAEVLQLLKRDASQAYDTYEYLLNEGEEGPTDPSRSGVARELARINLGLNYYTQWYWKVDLHNLFHFLSLRMDRHAQYEIRVYADKIAEMVKAWVPHAYEAFEDYRVGGSFLSKEELAILRQSLAGGNVQELIDGSGLSGREKREFRGKFGL